MTAEDLVWIIGHRGLLGSAVLRHLRSCGRTRVMTVPIPWAHEAESVAALRRGVDELADRAAGGGWRVVWCAGTGTPATPQPVLEAEQRVLAALLEAIGARIGAGIERNGALFLASSAGAVYGSSAEPPYDEATPPAPLSYYGVSKLAQESLARDFGERSGVPTLIGRISNLYGPGQNLVKPQGVITHLCRAHLTGQPVSIYVSMDTIRDYLFVDDCAAKIVDGVDLLRAGGLGDGATIKVLAAQQGTTLGAVIAECRRVFKRAPRVVLGASPLSAVQARDLRMRSVVAPAIDRRPLTPIGAGISATAVDLALAMQRGDLVARR